MASNRMIRRELKRKKLVAKWRKVRDELRKQLKDPSLTLEEKFEVQRKLQALPKDSAAVRVSNRCRQTGRARGVYRRFGISRHALRRHAMMGEVPGLVKASWG